MECAKSLWAHHHKKLWTMHHAKNLPIYLSNIDNTKFKMSTSHKIKWQTTNHPSDISFNPDIDSYLQLYILPQTLTSPILSKLKQTNSSNKTLSILINIITHHSHKVRQPKQIIIKNWNLQNGNYIDLYQEPLQNKKIR